MWPFLISLEYIPRNGLLGHMVTLCLTFWRTRKLFSKVADPWGFWFHYINIRYCAFLILAVLVGVKRYLVLFVCISLMSTNVEYLMCSSITSLSKCVLKFWSCFLIELFFYGWVVRVFICSGQWTFIRYMICKYFSHSAGCRSTFLVISFIL